MDLRFLIVQIEISQNLMSTNMLHCTFVKLANHIINHSCPILVIVLLPLYDEAIPLLYLTHTSPQLFLSPFLLVWNEPKVSKFACMNGNLSHP
jgi:hypothetical protein